MANRLQRILRGMVGVVALATPFIVDAPARADVIYTLGTGNIASGDGPGPYGFMALHLNPGGASAKFTFTGNLIAGFAYTFTEMGLNLSTTLANVTASPVSFTLAPGSNQTPSFAITAGNMDGFGNFNFRETPVPNGASAALSKASFTLTRTLGVWSTELSVLTANNKGQLASEHFIVNGGPLTGFNTNSSSCVLSVTCPLPAPFIAGAAEPVSLALLGTGLVTLAYARRKRV